MASGRCRQNGKLFISGKNVVYLTLGDSSIYCTVTYLQRIMESHGYETRLVSGIPSFCAAAARMNTPLSIWNGKPYLLYLIPGVESLTTMNGSFNAIAQNLNVQRLYEKAFDQVMISPTPLWQFAIGQILAGSIRGLYAGAAILLLVWPIHTGLIFNGISVLVLFLNGCVFSALGVVVSFLSKSHADVPRFSTYIIMPMAFLCNTFSSTENMPGPSEGCRAFCPCRRPAALSEALPMVKLLIQQGSWCCLSILQS